MRRGPSWFPALVAGVALALAGGALLPGLLSARTAFDLSSDGAVLGIAALGTAFVLAAGSLDLSVGALAALASVAFAVLVERTGMSALVAAPLVVLGGAAIGLILGVFVHFLEMPAFVVSLAAMFLLRAAALAWTEESIAITDANWTRASGWSLTLFDGSLRASALVFVVVAVVLTIAARRSHVLRDVWAVGGDAHAAWLAGVRVGRARLAAHALCSACAAGSGLVFALYGGAGSSIACAGLELDAIAACVVGGIALSGGRGSVVGAIVGALLLALFQRILAWWGGFDVGWTRVAFGLMLFASLAFERIGALRSARR